jgi:biotin carboxyl carrier protein
VTAYVALLDGGRREVGIGVERVAPGVYEVRIGERVHRVDAFVHDYGTLSLLVDDASHSLQLDARGGGAVRVHLRDSVFPVEILDEKRLRMRRAPARFTVEGRRTLEARLPGRVVRLLARPGDPVAEGQVVAVVEALDMENELRSPKSGKVVEVVVLEGQAVERGAPIAIVE